MVDAIKYQGALEKQGRLKKWKRYWFVLQDSQLCYFKDEKLASSPGIINMTQVDTVRECKSSSRLYTLEITLKSKSYILAANSKELQKKWLSVLHQAMTLESRRSHLRQSMSAASCNSISDEEEVQDAAADGEVFYDEVGASNQDPEVEEALYNSGPQIKMSYSDVHDVIPPLSPSDESMYAEVHSDSDQTHTPPDHMYSEVMEKNRLKEQGLVPKGAKSKSPSPGAEQMYSEVTEKNRLKEKGLVPEGAYGEVSEDTEVTPQHQAASPRQSAPPLPPRPSSMKTKPPVTPKPVNTTLSATPSVFEFPPTTPPPPPTTSPPPMPTVSKSPSPEKSSPGFIPSNNNFASIPDLPHPRLEMDFNSAFYQIRLFIAKHRGPQELYDNAKQSEANGEAVIALREYLCSL